MRLIFIRHGEPDYVHDTLTEKGWREAKLLAERASQWDVTEFYCSPLGRAKDTASLTLEKVGRDAVVLDWMQEFHAAIQDPVLERTRIPWDFMPEYWTRDPKLYQKDQWMDADVMKTGPVKQVYEEIGNGIDDLLASYGYEREGNFYRVNAKKRQEGGEETLVLFCHFGVTMAMLSHLLGIAAPLLWQGFILAPTSVTVLTSEERMEGEAYFRCQVMGDTRHLWEGEEPISPAGFFADVFQQ